MSTNVGGTPRSVTVEELYRITQGGREVELIDVRTPGEYGSAHIPQARSVPVDTLDPAAVMAGRARPEEPLYVVCQSGGRSRKACAAFTAAGFGGSVVNVEGGTQAWRQAGFPLTTGARSVIPLDRQVRIAIGAVIVLGTTLGMLVDPWFHLISGLSGAGLVFAGVTDFCPLSMVLSAMPWNRASGPSQACAT
ncbi:MAG: rhodanese-like domain-containing protein [Isosphaeraceae bacterium]